MSTTPAASTVLPAPQAWRALAALCLGFFMILLDQTIVAVATPGIMADFGARLDQVVWVTSIYLLCLVVPLLFTGRLGDRFGQRTLFQKPVHVDRTARRRDRSCRCGGACLSAPRIPAGRGQHRNGWHGQEAGENLSAVERSLHSYHLLPKRSCCHASAKC